MTSYCGSCKATFGGGEGVEDGPDKRAHVCPGRPPCVTEGCKGEATGQPLDQGRCQDCAYDALMASVGN